MPELTDAVKENEAQRTGKTGAQLKKVHSASAYIGKEKKRVTTLGNWTSCDVVFGLQKAGRYFVPKGVDANDDERLLRKAIVS